MTDDVTGWAEIDAHGVLDKSAGFYVQGAAVDGDGDAGPAPEVTVTLDAGPFTITVKLWDEQAQALRDQLDDALRDARQAVDGE